MSNKIKAIGLITMLLMVVGISGCITSNSTTTNTKNKTINDDFYIDGEPSIDKYADGTEYITINFRSKSGSGYSNIKTNVTGYDINNKIVYNKIHIIPYLEANYGQLIDFETKKSIDHVDMVVINATKES